MSDKPAETWQELIDRLLNEKRPDRYEVDGGDEWLDSIAKEVSKKIPEKDVRLRFASEVVRRREGSKMQRANRILRKIYETSQRPLDWMDVARLPIAVGKERVALEAATPDDLEHFATDERRDAASEFSTRNDTCEAAEWLAKELHANDCDFLRQWEPLPDDEEVSEAAS